MQQNIIPLTKMLRLAYIILVASTIKSFGDEVELKSADWILNHILNVFNMTGIRSASQNYETSIEKPPGKPVQTMDPVLWTTNCLWWGLEVFLQKLLPHDFKKCQAIFPEEIIRKSTN